MFKIGDIIKDIEDGDCYVIAIVNDITEDHQVLNYRIIATVWNGELTIEYFQLSIPIWWKIELYK